MLRRTVPCLVLDVGDTLLRRSRPGPKRRVLQWLASRCDRSTVDERAVADAVLTAINPDAATEAVGRILSLPEAERQALHQVLTAPEGRARIEPGAEELMSTARANGWRVVLASNAVGWAPPLPKRLRPKFDAYVSSAHLGWSKHDPEFWRALIRDQGLEPRFTLAVGDSPRADVEPARAVGLTAMSTGDLRSGLHELATAVALAGPPPPEAVAVLAGCVETLAGRPVVRGDNLGFLIERATRTPVLLRCGEAAVRAQIVRRAADAPAVAVLSEPTCGVVLKWVACRSDLRMRNVPDELERALAAAGLSLQSLPDGDRRHAVSLVREAANSAVRTARIRDIVATLGGGAGDV